MGIWHSRQTTSLRGNRFYRRPERSHCFGLSLFRQSSLAVDAAVELFRVCCQQDLEGVIIKAARGPYNEAPRSWLKVINPNYSQHRGRREMLNGFREHPCLFSLKAISG